MEDQSRKNWNTLCLNSINKEKAEIAKKYNIRFGQTEIYCARCDHHWGFGKHICADLVFEKMYEAKKQRMTELMEIKKEKKRKLIELRETSKRTILSDIKSFGISKLSIYLELPKSAVSMWIKRNKVPDNHLEKVLQVIQGGNNDTSLPKTAKM